MNEQNTESLKGWFIGLLWSCIEKKSFQSVTCIFFKQREHAAETAQQEEKIAQLEHALDEAANNSNEMHKILSEMLSAQKDTSTFQVWRFVIYIKL